MDTATAALVAFTAVLVGAFGFITYMCITCRCCHSYSDEEHNRNCCARLRRNRRVLWWIIIDINFYLLIVAALFLIALLWCYSLFPETDEFNVTRFLLVWMVLLLPVALSITYANIHYKCTDDNQRRTASEISRVSSSSSSSSSKSVM